MLILNFGEEFIFNKECFEKDTRIKFNNLYSTIQRIYTNDNYNICFFKNILHINKKFSVDSIHVKLNYKPQTSFTIDIKIKDIVSGKIKQNENYILPLADELITKLNLSNNFNYYNSKEYADKFYYFEICNVNWKNATYPFRDEIIKRLNNFLGLCFNPSLKLEKKSRSNKYLWPEHVNYLKGEKDHECHGGFAFASSTKVYYKGNEMKLSLIDKSKDLDKLFMLIVPLYMQQYVRTPFIKVIEVPKDDLNNCSHLLYETQNDIFFDCISCGITNNVKFDNRKIQDFYIMFKPDSYNYFLDFFSNFDVCKIDSFIIWDANLDDFPIRYFYPNCHERPYGQDWYLFLKSEPLVIIKFFLLTEDIEYTLKYIHNLKIMFREKSKKIWTRNIIHAPENLAEHNFMAKFYDNAINNIFIMPEKNEEFIKVNKFLNF